jgi:hypothetical protein
MAQLEMISCAAYCADAKDMVQLRIIKEILRIDKSRSCFDFTTVFATLLGWGSRFPQNLPIWQNLPSTCSANAGAKLRPEISFFHSPKWRGHSETEGILKLQ